MPRELTRMSSRVRVRKRPLAAEPARERIEVRRILPFAALVLAWLAFRYQPADLTVPLASAAPVLLLLPWGVTYSVHRFAIDGGRSLFEIWFDIASLATMLVAWNLAAIMLHGHGTIELMAASYFTAVAALAYALQRRNTQRWASLVWASTAALALPYAFALVVALLVWFVKYT